jgi:hypothetical protein
MGEEIELYESEDKQDEDTKVHDLRLEPTLPVPVTLAKTHASTAKEGRNAGEQVHFRPQGSLTTAPEQTARMRNKVRHFETATPDVDMEILDNDTQMDTVATEAEANDGMTVNREVHFVFNAALMSDPGTPATIEEALAGPEKVPWLKSIMEEINNKPVSWKEVMLKKRKIIPQKWVFKKKAEQDRTILYKSRSVMKGFLQIPGVGFTESFSPVANDSNIRIRIGLVLYYEDDQWMCDRNGVENLPAPADERSDQSTLIGLPASVEYAGGTGRKTAMYECKSSQNLLIPNECNSLQALLYNAAVNHQMETSSPKRSQGWPHQVCHPLGQLLAYMVDNGVRFGALCSASKTLLSFLTGKTRQQDRTCSHHGILHYLATGLFEGLGSFVHEARTYSIW